MREDLTLTRDRPLRFWVRGDDVGRDDWPLTVPLYLDVHLQPEHAAAASVPYPVSELVHAARRSVSVVGSCQAIFDTARLLALYGPSRLYAVLEVGGRRAILDLVRALPPNDEGRGVSHAPRA